MYIWFTLLLYTYFNFIVLPLCFKISAFRKKESSEHSVVENKRKNWAEDGS